MSKITKNKKNPYYSYHNMLQIHSKVTDCLLKTRIAKKKKKRIALTKLHFKFEN